MQSTTTTAPLTDKETTQQATRIQESLDMIQKLRDCKKPTPTLSIEKVCIQQEGQNKYIFDSDTMLHGWAYERYKNLEAAVWTAQEIDCAKEEDDLNLLILKYGENIRELVYRVLSFFAFADGIITENISNHFASEIVVPEIRFFLQCQASQECVHQETYTILLKAIARRKTAQLFKLATDDPVIAAMGKWALNAFNSNERLAVRTVAAAIFEGLFFSAPFCIVFWIKTTGLMNGFTFSNELISRDEGEHTLFDVELYSRLDNKLSSEEVCILFGSAVLLCQEFASSCFPDGEGIAGLTEKSMHQYIEYVADKLIEQLGFAPIYKATNPFTFMERISMQGKTNMFERTVSEYAKPGLSHKIAEEEDFHGTNW